MQEMSTASIPYGATETIKINNGTALNDWASNLDLTLLYDNRQSNSFRGKRKRTPTSPLSLQMPHPRTCISDCDRTISTFSTPLSFNQTRRSRQANTVLLATTLELPKSAVVRLHQTLAKCWRHSPNQTHLV